MKVLLNSAGLPIVRETETDMLSFENGLTCGGYGRKKASQMSNLLCDYTEEFADTDVYDVYRDIVFEKDKPVFEKDQYRYDITVVLPGCIGNERKKTSGHFHCYNPEHTNTYAEVYEVLYGKALFVLQRADNFENADEELDVKDVILVKVHEGQTLLVPPNYGHCSVNIGVGPMIFSNLAYVPCGIDYGPVQKRGGMPVFAKEEDGTVRFVKNEAYKNLPNIHFAVPTENAKFGIKFGKPVYQSYIETPEAFDFLGNVDPYADEIVGMLKICGDNWK